MKIGKTGGHSFLCLRLGAKDYRWGVGAIIQEIKGIIPVDEDKNIYDVELMWGTRKEIEEWNFRALLKDVGFNPHLLNRVKGCFWLTDEYSIERLPNKINYDEFCFKVDKKKNRYVVTALDNEEYKSIFAMNGNKLLGTIFTTMSDKDLYRVREEAEKRLQKRGKKHG